MNLKWHGTASVEISHAGTRILFDPFVPLKGSSANVAIGNFDGFSDIFVTHGHFDHISDIPKIVERNPETVIHCTGTPLKTLRAKGVPERNLDLITYGQELRIGEVALRVYRGRHAVLEKPSFSRLMGILTSPHKGNLPHILREHRVCKENDETVCYFLEAGGKTVFLMGSLNLREDAEYPSGPDLLVLPYNGWKDNLPPAVRAIERLRPGKVILTHYDVTFPPFTVPVDLTPLLEKYNGLVSTIPYEEEVEI